MPNFNYYFAKINSTRPVQANGRAILNLHPYPSGYDVCLGVTKIAISGFYVSNDIFGGSTQISGVLGGISLYSLSA